ncbi:uncharacterized protein LOC117317809 [Pecten maximus]|uniref:uncharacterized protein LOC117317809 n=1 Tax=Pecten maximus TaxID=6579 RepID=UPI001458A343|nr:uncharacterized protein LOC117317809 [Pecten maximus]XP_033728640.1 uncharacterized protein LOC117317809 [Pecten maximus]
MDKALINYKKAAHCKLSNPRADGPAHAQSVDFALSRVKGHRAVRTCVRGTLDSLVKCPICNTHIVVPESATNMDLDRANMNYKSTKSSNAYVPKLLLSAENGLRHLCDTCSNDEQEVTCIECDQNLCFDCTRVHLKTSATRRHHITGLADSAGSPRRENGETTSFTKDLLTSLNGLTSSTSALNSVLASERPKTVHPVTSQLRYSDLYQRGNSPRPTEKRKRFEFKQLNPKGWGTDFTLVTTFDVGSYVLSMCAASRDQVWISEAMSSAIHLYNIEGQRLRSVNVHSEVRDMALNKASDEIFVTCFANKTIKVISPENKIFTFLTLPLHPAGIAINSYGDVVICGVEDFRRRYRPEQRNRLLIYSREGKRKREIEHDQMGERLFKYPEYIDININGDMCVSDIERESLMILREDGRLKNVYKGPPKGTLDKTFDPRDVKCDKEGNIVVCDINNNALHLLDISGDFTRILLYEEDGIYWPDILAIDHRNHIWVRELWQQSIKVFQALGTY